MMIRETRARACLLAMVTLAGCAMQDTDQAMIPSGGDDCFWANSIYDWRALDDEALIVWSPSRGCPYLVEFARRCIGIRFTEDIAFSDRDNRICPYGGDAVIVPGPGGDRCSIASITRLSPEALDVLLGKDAQSGDVAEQPGECRPDTVMGLPEGASITSDDVGESQTWGAAKNVVGVKHLYFSSQPDEETLRLARDNGVGVIINFRPAAELTWDEEKAATDLGLAYYNLPISRTGSSFDTKIFERAGQLVRQHRDAGILLHCSSGNRAAAWFAAHLVQDHGLEIEPSIELAKKAGLTSPAMEARVRTYLSH